MKRSCRDPYYIQVTFEYLLHMGLLDTATVFKEECEVKKYPVPHSNLTKDDLKCKLLQYFDLGEEEPFFQVFDSSISQLQQGRSAESKKLVANLYLYFASMRYVRDKNQTKRSISDIEQDDSQQIQIPNFLLLSKFLENDCFTLRNDPEFTPYFSLAFASNPLHHHLFVQTFKDCWISNLRRCLQEYLWIHHPAFKVPDIVAFIPTKAHSDIYCCVPHQDFTSSCETTAEENNLSDGNNFKVVNDHEHFSECNAHESNFISENESEVQETMHSHKNTALFIRRQNHKSSTSRTSTSNINLEMEGCQQDYEQLKKKFSQLHSDYHNLIGVASELTCALESCVRGQQCDLKDTLNNCIQIFPELFPQNQHRKKIRNRDGNKNISLDSNSCEWTLHIALIKNGLTEGSVKTRLLLLQALRWAITKSSSDKRKCIMNQFLKLDLLNLQGETLLVSLLTPSGVVTPHPLQQSAARLLNTFASIQSGRSYLAQNSEMIKATTTALKEQDQMCTDSITKNMLVAALQKLSLRRSQRVAMIQSGVVEWIFDQLSKSKFESSYSLEYGTALLMNLCLHQSAKELCIPIAQTVFGVLSSLLSSSIFQALPYINGTLYSLITHPRLNEIAAEVGLRKALEENLAKQTNLDIRRQMEHILQYHLSLLQSDCANTFPLPVSEGELIDEDDEELDLLGEELDEQDPVRSINGELNGEDLLRAHYSLPTNANGNNDYVPTAQTEEVSTLILRPTTPHHSSQSESVAETSHAGNFEATSAQDISKKNNWHLRRSGMKQPQLFNRQDENRPSRSQTLAFKSEVNGSVRKIEQPEQWQQTYPNGTSGKQHASSREGQWKELPEISIHLACTSDSTDTDNNFNWDEDSEDVQVGGEPSKEPCLQTARQTTGVPHEEDMEKIMSTKKGTSDTDAAFSSRPKIPRTPPHRH